MCSRLKPAAYLAAVVSARLRRVLERRQARLPRVMHVSAKSEETDQNRQALLEIHCAVVLGTPYNDFGTHEARRAPGRSTSALG